MFANKIVDGKPICPMKGCHQPIVEPGGGAAFKISKQTAEVMFRQGVTAHVETVVLVHKACA
jgi:hypothetical protein